MIDSSAHRSIRLFSSGVPVIASLNGAGDPAGALVGLRPVVLDELRLVQHQPDQASSASWSHSIRSRA